MSVWERVQSQFGKLRLGAERIFNGARGSAHKKKETKSSTVTPGPTAWHEGGHAGVAIATEDADPKKGTIVPHGNILGSVEFNRFSAVVAAAGAALGDHEHAGGDYVIARAHGANWDAAVEESKSVVRANMDIIHAIASAFEEHGTLSGAEMHDVADEARYGAEMIITLIASDGTQFEGSVFVKIGTKEIPVPIELLNALVTLEKNLERTSASGRESKNRNSNISELAPADLPRDDIKTEDDFRPYQQAA